MTRQFKTLQFKSTGTDEDGVFEGYAAVFGNIDDGNDIIEPGAFTETIKDNFDRIKILKQHGENSTIPIGKPLELYEDEHGLFIKGKIIDTTDGMDMRKLLKADVVNEMSIGYDAVEVDEENVGGIIVRHLTKIVLWEVSLVAWAMNPEAVVTRVKSRPNKFARSDISAMTWKEREQVAQWLESAKRTDLIDRRRAAVKAARLHIVSK